ncbi:hypothetical protein [Bacillus thuringiensis]|uniref:hypothetical protein n=1 Tax=Bacillus thuringiensis TaxID=1428 RepID=UPI000B4385B2|nr:hypothetical protein [Bacillus thuringiensis]MEB9469435.1 hypothetical protein [Bacillus cereus]OUA18911.1 hypothetical protein BK776_27725 [Bacillus thuringiensis serovar aizawai]
MPIKQITDRDVSIQFGKGDVISNTFLHEGRVAVNLYEVKDEPWKKKTSIDTCVENLDKPSVVISFDKAETLEAFITQLQGAANKFKSKENL